MTTIPPEGLLHITKTGAVPHGGFWRYVDPETGRKFSHPYLIQLRTTVRVFRASNNLPIGSDWEAQFEDNICRNTPEPPCATRDGHEAATLWQMARNFAASMKTWVTAGLPLASDEVIAERRAICQGLDGYGRCPYWRAAPGAYFGRCASCGCFGLLKTALATEACPKGKWKR